MAYWKDVWRFPNSIEYEFKWAGKYGAKGEKRGKKKRASPEQIKKQNQLNKEKRMRRLIKANFIPGDMWCTLKYPEGERKPPSEVKDDMSRFLRAMRTEYKRRQQEFKFIYRMEVGARGGIHIHILLNRLKEGDTDLVLQDKWIKGRANYESVYEDGGYERLACYIVKEPEKDSEQYEQLSLFDDADRKELIKYSSSRNLIRPAPERTEYMRWTVRKILENGPVATEGYYIDKDSVVMGVNKYTGMSYLYYTEIKIDEVNTRNGPWKEGEWMCDT